MYISRIMIENIRCFGTGEYEVDLDLQRPDGSFAGWTVLAGRNGAGKTTFLRAIALTVAGARVASVLQETSVGWLRRGEQWGITRLTLSPDARDGDNPWREDERPTVAFEWHLDSFSPKEGVAAIADSYGDSRMSTLMGSPPSHSRIRSQPRRAREGQKGRMGCV
jgi:hypothetical protein